LFLSMAPGSTSRISVGVTPPMSVTHTTQKVSSQNIKDTFPTLKYTSKLPFF
jgi:hypothetical protein